MLKQNLQKSLKQTKLYESVLKQKVRNLRAKVQSLLPIHFCQKIFKRNNRLRNQQLRKQKFQMEDHQNRSMNSMSHTQTPWKYTSGFNLKKGVLPQKRSEFFSQNQSEKTSLHLESSQYQQYDDLFFDEEFINIMGEVKGNGRPKKDAMMKRYHFEKLTDEEIEQIEEDKMYYLGQEKHIKAYEQFIKKKCMQKNTVPISNQVYKSVSKSFINIGTGKNLPPNKHPTHTSLEQNKFDSSKAKNNWVKKISINKHSEQKKTQNHSIMQSRNDVIHSGTNYHSQSQEFRIFRNTTNEKLGSNVNENLARINEEEQIRRILISMELKSRQERVEENFNKIMKTRIQIIEQENLKDHFKILTAQQKKRKIHQQVGQIVDLTQKLRKKCIQRKTIINKENLNSQPYVFDAEN